MRVSPLTASLRAFVIASSVPAVTSMHLGFRSSAFTSKEKAVVVMVNKNAPNMHGIIIVVFFFMNYPFSLNIMFDTTKAVVDGDWPITLIR